MMNKIVKTLVLLFIFLAGFFPVLAVNYPIPAGYVNDFAGLYSASFRQSLESGLSSFSQSTGDELTVVTVKTLEGSDIETYANELFTRWGIGKKGKDNGVMLLIAKDERKVRIEVGYGLEQYINDARAGDIIRNRIAPSFQKSDYEGGTKAAVDQIESYISDKNIAPSVAPTVAKDTSWGGLIPFIGAFLYIFLTYLAGYLGRTKEIWPGAAIGGVLGAIGGFFVLSVIGLIAGGVLFGGLGLLFDYVLTKNYKVRSQRGLSTGWWTTWGGFGGGGGGNSGGGFGGFGGGSSGGGGASGGW